VPRKLISIFDPRELELMISGLPEIDSNLSHSISKIFKFFLVEDLRKNTRYRSYKESD